MPAKTCACGSPMTGDVRCRACDLALRRAACTFHCAFCGASFVRPSKGRDSRTYCSRACSDAKRRAVSIERAQAVTGLREARKARPCAGCGVAMGEALGHRCASCRLAHAREQSIAHYYAKVRAVFVRQCSECGISFEPPPGVPGLHRVCSDRCREVNIKRHKRVHRAARKARMRGAQVEAVNPISVFIAARWRCALCGVSTPKTLRGTYDDRAPELDHIIPIACGGEHTYANV